VSTRRCPAIVLAQPRDESGSRCLLDNLYVVVRVLIGAIRDDAQHGQSMAGELRHQTEGHRHQRMFHDAPLNRCRASISPRRLWRGDLTLDTSTRKRSEGYVRRWMSDEIRG